MHFLLIRDTFSNHFLMKPVVVCQSGSNVIFLRAFHGIFHAERGREPFKVWWRTFQKWWELGANLGENHVLFVFFVWY